jgi:CubicO group peptidase (beta-lactamase class C family)
MTNYQQLLDQAAQNVMTSYQLPNIAAVMVRDQGQTVLSTAQGIRDASLPASLPSNQVNTSDYFNVGSISKPIFGMLLACLIKQGLLQWTTTIGKVFTEFTSAAFRARCGMNTNFLDTQLYELTSHTSGIDGMFYFVQDPNQNDPNYNIEVAEVADPYRFIDDWEVMQDGGSERDLEWENLPSVVYRRYLYTVLSLKQQKFMFNQAHNDSYDNKAVSGYGSSAVIAAAMCERRAGKPFEQLMNELLTNTIPMQICYGLPPRADEEAVYMQMHDWDPTSGTYVVCRFGQKPAATGQVAPFPVQPAPIATGPFAPFQPKFLTGTMSCTVDGMAQFIKYNLNALANPAMFDLAAYHKQVTVYDTQGGIALSGGGEPYWHSGENPGANAWMEVYPSGGHGLAVMVNAESGPTPAKSAKKAVGQLVTQLRGYQNAWP